MKIFFPLFLTIVAAGSGVAPAQSIAVSPTEFQESSAEGESVSTVLTIQNAGNSPLGYELSSSESWLQFDAANSYSCTAPNTHFPVSTNLYVSSQSIPTVPPFQIRVQRILGFSVIGDRTVVRREADGIQARVGISMTSSNARWYSSEGSSGTLVLERMDTNFWTFDRHIALWSHFADQFGGQQFDVDWSDLDDSRCYRIALTYNFWPQRPDKHTVAWVVSNPFHVHDVSSSGPRAELTGGLAPYNSKTISVIASTEGLLPGRHTADVTLTSSSGVQTIPFHLDVLGGGPPGGFGTPAEGEWRISYDDGGRVSRVDGGGQTAIYVYNDNGELKQATLMGSEAGGEVSQTLTSVVSPAIGGLVTGWGLYADGSEAIVEAIPETGFSFVKWIGSDVPAGVSFSNPLTLTMDRDRLITAQFRLDSESVEYSEWISQQFPNAFEHALLTGTSDGDSDGWNNRHEFLMGFAANDPSEQFRVRVAEVVGGDVCLEYNRVRPTGIYQLWHSTDLNEWTEIDAFSPSLAEDNAQIDHVGAASFGQGFYMVQFVPNP